MIIILLLINQKIFNSKIKQLNINIKVGKEKKN